MAPVNSTRAGAGPQGLFYRIALRLVVVALLFTMVNAAIILTMYVRDRDELAQGLVSMQAERVARLLGAAAPAAADPGGGLQAAYRVFAGDGTTVLSYNPSGLPLPEAAPAPAVRSATQRDDLGGDAFRLAGTRRIERGGGQYWVVLTLSGHGFRPFLPAVLKELFDHALVPLLPLALLLMLFNTEVVRRMLAPLEQAVTAVDAIDPARIGQRLPLPDGPLEVRKLIGAFNRAMDRMEGLIRMLRDFTADAAHELRTPLSIMTLSIGQLPDSQTKRKLQADAAGMTRLVGQMLELAQAEALRLPPGATASLAEVATTVIEQLTPVAVGRKRSIRLEVLEQPVIAGQADMLERALRNVIENGLAHTPEGTAVEVQVGPGAAVSVRDHGGGIAPEHVSHVFKRFWRADRRSSAGSGLGLGIALRIVQAHGGTIEIGNAPGGGAQLRLAFPGPA
jgi:signal transduction histidine kinase